MSPIAAFQQEFEKPKRVVKSRDISARAAGNRRARKLAPIEVAIDDAKRRAASGDWDSSRGATFVGLYALCHQMIYGIVPEELFALGDYRIAIKLAAKMLHENFDDNASALAEFVRWSWEREKKKHAWALGNGFDRKRLGWKWQFSLPMLTDYRIARSQRRA